MIAGKTDSCVEKKESDYLRRSSTKGEWWGLGRRLVEKIRTRGPHVSQKESSTGS